MYNFWTHFTELRSVPQLTENTLYVTHTIVTKPREFSAASKLGQVSIKFACSRVLTVAVITLTTLLNRQYHQYIA